MLPESLRSICRILSDSAISFAPLAFFGARMLGRFFIIAARLCHYPSSNTFAAGIPCFNTENRHDRRETERFKPFTYDELIQRDKLSLDIFWLKDESLEDSENLPAPDALARDIVESLQAALEQFMSIAEDLGEGDESEVRVSAQAAD